MTQYDEDEDIMVDETPTPMAMVWANKGYDGYHLVGQVVRTTAKNIWIDTSQGRYYFRKGVMRFILRSNGQYANYTDGDLQWLYFQPDPLVKFMLNGKA